MQQYQEVAPFSEKSELDPQKAFHALMCGRSQLHLTAILVQELAKPFVQQVSNEAVLEGKC